MRPPTINRQEFEKEERRAVSSEDFQDALEKVLLADKPEGQSSENRTPTKAELKQKQRLDRC